MQNLTAAVSLSKNHYFQLHNMFNHNFVLNVQGKILTLKVKYKFQNVLRNKVTISRYVFNFNGPVKFMSYVYLSCSPVASCIHIRDRFIQVVMPIHVEIDS